MLAQQKDLTGLRDVSGVACSLLKVALTCAGSFGRFPTPVVVCDQPFFLTFLSKHFILLQAKCLIFRVTIVMFIVISFNGRYQPHVHHWL
jgi:hypothetical protein